MKFQFDVCSATFRKTFSSVFVSALKPRLSSPLLFALTLLVLANCDTETMSSESDSADSGSPVEAYVDNGDGTIKQSQTGMVWQKTDDGAKRNWTDAQNYCQNLNLGGKSDWRLPTILELRTLSDFSDANPAIPSALDTHNGSDYWSATEVSDPTYMAWAVHSTDGRDLWKDKTTSHWVRCVSKDPTPNVRLEFFNLAGNKPAIRIAEPEIVKQLKLVFMGEDDGIQRTWNAAADYCKNLDYGGVSSWRLPSLNEIKALVNPSHYNPTAVPAANMRSNDFRTSSYWSSTPLFEDSNKAWTIYVKAGTDDPRDVTENHYIRCVHKE